MSDDLVLQRRMRILREILADPDNPFRARLIDLTDMVVDTELGLPMPLTTSANGNGINRRIDLPGSPPPRQDSRGRR